MQYSSLRLPSALVPSTSADDKGIPQLWQSLASIMCGVK
ncbi:hypothetical protein BACUNI_01292 [Bacteroides uniformis ATCC 8492]|uniref:Uncharacterized protein n=1 Tax=Bacteroides uniformis (strain ATCC 8492 / DSM 6597 / CCUG 4942 / CIP 103695 / JCM 5828 / KCTC 5204 / NCTC 13054 / VPI 0061) TaxID=411479 RepID=A0ABC9NFC1_BACUC|nr:hypothetical protein BACUNI_01292 [Bacteroides uniformis ATCC 8492]